MKSKLIISFILLSFFTNGQKLYTVTKDTILMGSAFVFTAVHKNPEKAWVAISKGMTEVGRIESLISSWRPSSETSLINKNAGIKPVKVSKELIDLISRSQKISNISNGYFDVSFASLDKIWMFNKQETKEIPSAENIKKSVALIDFENIIINENDRTVFLKNKGMKIGFGGIGKGYAADRAKAIMQQHGALSGVVNAGGDLISWGKKENGGPWTIGIANPKDKNEVMLSLDISNLSVVTSGNYEKYFIYQGKKYCHIINPKTGWPVSGVESVSIMSPSAEFSDALATTVFILGKEEGLKLIDHLEGVEGIILDDKGNASFSKNIQTNIID